MSRQRRERGMNARLSLTRQRLVVVGNGMAGTRTVEELLKLAPEA